jgi:hypothetical protein
VPTKGRRHELLRNFRKTSQFSILREGCNAAQSARGGQAESSAKENPRLENPLAEGFLLQIKRAPALGLKTDVRAEGHAQVVMRSTGEVDFVCYI